ncbi:Hint domain-containing protein [Leisingera daeponensis]|uniref:Hint domain-containing protein n=1 Tax=Leisingera daeponensis TaxID=405746 RepID=A0ABS7N9M0_9RHOB|nr:Hint domain-containing protein [Leisingera daeponensis]MBY6137898.1 Hint domain-containing protein [Leisingera daeponensis]
MQLDHTTDFADYLPVDVLLLTNPLPQSPKPAAKRARIRSGGFLPGTLVETAEGFKQARDVKPGDMVFTFDGGAQEVKAVKHAVPRLTTLMHIPAGALGNDTDLMLPSDQKVALEMDTAERLFGLPVVIAKLIALAGYKGITAAAPERLGRIHFEFEEEELVWAESGMLLPAGDAAEDSAFHQLSLTETRQVLASDEGRALSQTGMGAVDARLPSPLDNLLDRILAA